MYQPDQDILEDFHALRHEMEAYNPALVEKPQMVLINKVDLYGPDRRDLRTLQMALEEVGIKSLPISALTGEGLEELKEIIAEKWVEE
jgi:GTP-binding protein